MKARSKTFEGEVSVCCHSVEFRYDIYELELNDELESCLTEEAESRALVCITEGCSSGDLNCLYIDHENDGKDYEVRGWWSIKSS